MTKQCVITGKKVISGFNVSHSHRRTKRKMRPNIHRRKILNPATGRYVTVWISNRGLRTVKKWDREGKTYNIAEMKRECKQK